ncbi:unnamed protein product [Heligmosomoides polygyrus]|uniref:Fibrinogen C-terminal domain-containing protein n=1 Tax=Heligmosomoides polygyrus TaxID=6339 RepID=A0A183G3A5_HELPZ|nr:unnamed protein product [Heligmosomoides polygyrus]
MKILLILFLASIGVAADAGCGKVPLSTPENYEVKLNYSQQPDDEGMYPNGAEVTAFCEPRTLRITGGLYQLRTSGKGFRSVHPVPDVNPNQDYRLEGTNAYGYCLWVGFAYFDWDYIYFKCIDGG